MGISATYAQRIDSLFTDSSRFFNQKHKLFVSPVLGYTPETRLFFGAGAVYYLPASKKHPKTHPSVFKLTAEYTLNKQIESNFTGESYFKDNLYNSNYNISYFEFPDYFYGIGNYTLAEDREKFDYNFFNIQVNAQRKVLPNFYTGIKTFLENTEIDNTIPGGLFDSLDIPGEEGGLNTGAGMWLTYNNRDNIYFPLKGMNIDVSIVLHSPFIGSDYQYGDYTFEFSKFNRVKKDDVFAFDLYGKFLPGDPPFNRMAELGGDSRMRGNYEGRFRDKNYIAVQGEYRITFWKFFGLTAFGGLGEVADAVSNFSMEGLKYSVGGGARIFIVPKEKISVRLDYGFGSEGSSGFYVAFREAF